MPNLYGQRTYGLVLGLDLGLEGPGLVLGLSFDSCIDNFFANLIYYS